MKRGRDERRRAGWDRNRKWNRRFGLGRLFNKPEVVIDQVGVDEALEVLLRVLLLQVDDRDFSIRNRFRFFRAGSRSGRITVRNVGERDQVVFFVVFVLKKREKKNIE